MTYGKNPLPCWKVNALVCPHQQWQVPAGPEKAVIPNSSYFPGARHGEETGFPGGHALAAHGEAPGACHRLLPEQGGLLTSRGRAERGPQGLGFENHHLQLFRNGHPRCPLQLPPGARRQSWPLWVFCPGPREPAPRGTQFWKGSCGKGHLCGKAHRPAYLDASRLPGELPLPGGTAWPLLGPSLPPAEVQPHPGQRHAPVPDVGQPRGAGTLAQWLQHLPGQRRLCVWPERGIELDEGETVPGRGWDGHGHRPLHTQWLHASVVHRGRHFWFNMDPFQQAHLKKGSWADSSL